MTKLELEMIEILKELKQNYSVVAIKAELEAEGSRLPELMRLKEVSNSVGLPLTIKIGGAEAISDMYDARQIGVSKIVAPMVESKYALQKYLASIQKAFPEETERDKTEFFVNIETIDAYKNFDKMLELENIKDLDGIVLGRSDMLGSLGLAKKDINSEQVFNIAKNLVLKANKAGLKFVIGGNVNSDSLDFFRRLPKDNFIGFETRKVIFKCPEALGDKAEEGINKALQFELLWLENKKNYYATIAAEDDSRIDNLQLRFSK